MQEKEFKKWLENERLYKTKKQVSDCVSRALRVERVMKNALGPRFSLDKEFKKDGGERINALLSHRGVNSEMDKLQNVDLPIGSNQLYPIKVAVDKYFEYLKTIN